MNPHKIAVAVASVGGALALFMPGAASAAASLIPLPASVVERSGSLVVREGSRIEVSSTDSGARAAANALVDLVWRTRGLKLRLDAKSGRSADGAIVFTRDIGGDEGAQGYALDVGLHGVTIRAPTDAGLFYGAMTLVQLLSPDAQFAKPVELTAMSVRDRPRFVWRGVLLDVARHFLSIPCLEAVIDQMAVHKLNVLHLHLTDDQGWRIEIKRYPKLTQIGALRLPQPGDGSSDRRVGGFYSQDQIRALVAYGAARQVTIVPEIDMPGHAQAAVAAYPEVGVFGDRPSVSNSWGVKPYLLGVDTQSFTFVENVLDEVMALFPSTYIHVGGDEAIKDQWRLSPAVQARMRELGIKSEDGLQSWFIERLGAYLAAHGRRLIGWDEILEGGLPASASVMSWRGERGAIDAANAGHDVVLAPAPTLYLDNLQTDRPDEQPGRLSVVSLKQVYAYEPVPAAISPDQAHHVLGAEAAVWTEYIVTPQELEHAAYPRLDALAEIAWSPKDKRDWPGFLARLQPQRLRYGRQGVNASDGAFAVTYKLEGDVETALRSGRAQVSLSTQADYGDIRYTLDGSAPTLQSALYRGPLETPLGVVIRATAFTPKGGQTAAARAFDTSPESLLTKSTGAISLCPNPRINRRVALTSDADAAKPAFDVDYLDACFLYPKAPLDLVGDFTIRAVRLPRHYAGAYDEEKVIARYRATAFGELVVHMGGCEGPVAATFPLPDPIGKDAKMTFKGTLAKANGSADLCLIFTASASGPSYAIESMSLTALPKLDSGPTRHLPQQ